MTEQPKFGQLIGPDEWPGRDAIHVAVAPVVASCELHPGEHVGVMNDGRAGPFMANPVGIVDPFLRTPVQAGERFWMFLYPGTITGLRHVWTHPAFVAKVPTNES